MKYANLPADKKVGNYVWNHQALLGSGAFGKVYLGKDTAKGDKFVAVKVMENKELKDEYLQKALQNEVQILSSLQGPYVVGLYDFLQTQSRTYIIQDFCNGGDFRSYLTKKGCLKEDEAKAILHDLLTGFKELVRNGLVHRDLKPENCLIHDGIFKVADYGFARKVGNYQKEMLTTQVGTPLYMSPQILKGEPYTTKSDVWSFGNIYYEMLFGKTPWPCRTQYDLVQNICSMPVKFPYDKPISEESKSFIKGCLAVNEAQRLSWDQVFEHPIYKNFKGGAQQAAQDQHHHHGHAHLDAKQRKVITELQKIVQSKNIDVASIFKNFDHSGNQSLDVHEFAKLLQVIDSTISAADAEAIFKKFDQNKDNTMSLAEFQKLILETDYSDEQCENEMLGQYRAKKAMKKLQDVIYNNNLDVQKIFTKFNKNGGTTLDQNEFYGLLKVIDEDLQANEATMIFRQIDKDHSGTLDFKEFKAAVEDGMPKASVNQQMEELRISNPVCPEVQTVLRDLKSIIAANHLDLGMIFANFDQDKTGQLDMMEFAKLVRVINSRLGEHEVRELFAVFDANNDKQITIAEFNKALQ